MLGIWLLFYEYWLIVSKRANIHKKRMIGKFPMDGK
jgi:hypothetical protein